MSLARVLVVDDEPTYRTSVSRCLTNNNYQVTAADSAEKALEYLTESRFDLVITDLKMSGMSGLDLLARMQEIAPNTAAIMMTAYAAIDTAIEATKRGAFHYLVKPFNIDDVIQLSHKAIEHKRLKEENTYLKRQLNRSGNLSNVIAKSSDMRDVVKAIEKAGTTDSTVLIKGETGTGKEFIAKSIHYTSLRSKKIIVNIDCGSMNSDALELELFGYVKGAFAGAVSSKSGKLELADGGTLFLNDVSDLSLNTQTKIFKIIEDKKFFPIGSTKAVDIDVRIIAATKRDIEQMVRENNFREDLFYRLNVIPINVPPLRDRKEDIPGLVNYFINYYSTRNGKQPIEIDEAVINILTVYSWPSNVRELKNLLERLVVLHDGKIDVSSLPSKYTDNKNEKPLPSVSTLNFVSMPKIVMPENGINLNDIVRDFEEDLIMQALNRTNWNKNRAAKLLRLNRTTLVEKLRKKGLINSREN
ncbi:MAG: sigma-54 dependent transcriptional regulator [Proteobacteria bacterium]|nr:sigma-54 dependent transcriptional regulator [Pseudomonadota bacterium]